MTRRRRGFTLLEVILAIALSAVVALAVGQVVSVMHTTQKRVRTRAARRALLSAIERQIVADLSAIVPPGGIYASGIVGEDQAGATGEALVDADMVRQVYADTPSGEEPPPVEERDRLTLAVLPAALTFGSEHPAGEGGLQSVIYYIDDDPQTEERGLVRQVERVRDKPEGADPEPLEQLSEDVVAMDLAFFDGQVWAETWDSGASDTLPTGIEVSLVVRVGEEIVTYRIMVAPAQGRPSALLEVDE